MRQAEELLQDAAQPDAGGRLEAAEAADPPSAQGGSGGDALAGIDEHEAMPEAAVRIDRERDIGMAALARHEIGAGVELAEIAFGIAREPPVAVARGRIGQHRERNAVGLDQPLGERPGDLVIAAGQRQGKLGGHARSFSASLVGNLSHRKELLGAIFRQVGLLVDELELDEGSLQRRKRARLEPAGL
jgi:hypothetical protein